MPLLRNLVLAVLAAGAPGCNFNSHATQTAVECEPGTEGCRFSETPCPTADVQCSIVCAGQALELPNDCEVVACDCPMPPPATCNNNADCGPGGVCDRICPVCITAPCPPGPCDDICVPATCQSNDDCGAGSRCDKSCTERRLCPANLQCARSCVGACVPDNTPCGDQTCGADNFCATVCPNCFGFPCPLAPCRLECAPDSAPPPANCPSLEAVCDEGVPTPAGCPLRDCTDE